MIDVRLAFGDLEKGVEDRLDEWTRDDAVSRLWARDTSLWSPDPETPELADRLGWIGLPEAAEAALPALASLAGAVAPWMTDLVLLGMGGSSLAPEVVAKAIGGAGLPLTVVDTTHPRTIRDMEWIHPANTLFVVASKSGTTVETLSLFQHFWSRVREISESPGDHFIAITDPDTPLATLGEQRDFLAVVEAPPDVGGRFSALSPFGLVPAVLMGVELSPLVESALEIADACRDTPRDNPAFRLAAALAEATLGGRDKATFVTSNPFEALPDWLEQLIAESTGKEGRGIVPIAHEPEREPSEYGDDRLFVGVVAPPESVAEAEQWGEVDDSLRRLDALEGAGHPVVRVEVDALDDLLGLFFVWEIAIAMVGAAMDVNPFDQPDVELAKRLAKQAMTRPAPEVDVDPTEAPNPDPTGADRDETDGGELDLAWDVPYYGHAGSGTGAPDPDTLTTVVGDFLALVSPGDYIAIHAYLPGGDSEELEALADLRGALSEATGVATTLGYGPRFLHSTGQLHKGGPPGGVFLQLVDDAGVHAPVPGTDYTFHQLIRAQARGDVEALESLERRVLRVRVSPAVEGIRRLIRLVEHVS